MKVINTQLSSGRRSMLKYSAFSVATVFGAQFQPLKAAAGINPDNHNIDVTKFQPIPKQAPATEGVLAVSGGAGLYFWDTGGDGPAIILSHPGSGSALSWPYQQAAFATAGFRTIGYSRRGHFGSPTGSETETGTLADDLNALVSHLNIDKFHIVGLAAGGFVVSDFAVSYPEKLQSMIIACSLFGLWDNNIKQRADQIRAQGFRDAPAEFRELGPSYRWAHPEGVAAWLAMHKKSQGDGQRVRQQPKSEISWQKLRAAHIPTLLISGGADLYQPPSMMRAAAEQLPGCETLVVPEVGHAVQWEQPEWFNRVVIDFVKRHS